MTDKTDNHSISSILQKQYNMRYLFHCVLIAMVSIVCGCRDCCTRSELFGMWELSDGSIRLLLDLGFEESYLKESFIRLDDDVYDMNIFSRTGFSGFYRFAANGNGKQWRVLNNWIEFEYIDNSGPDHYFSIGIEKTEGEISLMQTWGDPDSPSSIIKIFYHNVSMDYDSDSQKD